MAYSPGPLGQKTVSNFKNRIRELREILNKHNQWNVDIAVDGGMSEDKIQEYRENGANLFIFRTSCLFIPGKKLDIQIDRINNILNKI